MHFDPDDPARLSPHDRLRELAGILATGVRRCRGRGADWGRGGQKGRFSGPEQGFSSPPGLEFLPHSHPDGCCQRETSPSRAARLPGRQAAPPSRPGAESATRPSGPTRED